MVRLRRVLALVSVPASFGMTAGAILWADDLSESGWLWNNSTTFSVRITVFWSLAAFVFLENVYSLRASAKDDERDREEREADRRERERLALFRDAVSQSYDSAREGAREALFYRADAEALESVVRYHLRAVARNAAFYDGRRDADARYAANVMIFLPQADVRASSLWFSDLRQDQLLGALYLDPLLGTFANSAPLPDYDLSPLALPVPADGSMRLPGAPTAFLDPDFRPHTEDVEALIQRCAKGDFGESVGPRLRCYLAMNRGVMQSWASIALRDLDNDGQLVGVLNIHSTGRGTLERETQYFFDAVHSFRIELGRYIPKIVAARKSALVWPPSAGL